MTGWQIMTYGLVSGLGALAFMTLVANEIELATMHLRLLEAAEGKAQRQRKKAEEVYDVAVAEKVA